MLRPLLPSTAPHIQPIPWYPPYGHPVVQVRNPPDDLPDNPAPPIIIISKEFATRTLANCYNVRSKIRIGLGTPHHICPYTVRGIKTYTHLSCAQWNADRLQFNSAGGIELSNLLHEIYRSILHHQESLINQRVSAVYTLPRSRRACMSVISVLLAPFETQLYIESGREGMSAAIWGDFTNSQRPHPGEEDYAVELALNTPM